MSLTWESTRKAAKEHQCDWCFTPITKGESHIYGRQPDDGDFYTWRYHHLCQRASIQSWLDANAQDGDPVCQERHDFGKTCEETPCGNAINVPLMPYSGSMEAKT